MRAELANLNDCAVPFISRAAVNYTTLYSGQKFGVVTSILYCSGKSLIFAMININYMYSSILFLILSIELKENLLLFYPFNQFTEFKHFILIHVVWDILL